MATRFLLKMLRLTTMFACLVVCSALTMTLSADAQEKPRIQVAEATAEATEEAPAAEKAKRKGAGIVPAAKAFLATLSEEQTGKAVFEFSDEKRVQWHFIPMETRKGLPIMEMKEEQKAAALKLFRASLSKAGYDKATKIMSLESVLLKLEGPSSEGRRNPEKYYFTVFGEPKFKKRWGLSVEGHHLSLNFVFEGNKVLDSTPQFFATNPAELQDDYGEGFPKGLRVLKTEEELGFKLVNSLTEEQLKKATIPGETPQEIRGAGEAQPTTERLPGIAVSEFDDSQKKMLQNLLKAYTAKMKPPVAKARWEAIEKAGWESVTFSWSGAKRSGIGHYYVVQGPTFVVEFINVQPDAAGNPANHIHCVWRDMDGDFDLPIEG